MKHHIGKTVLASVVVVSVAIAAYVTRAKSDHQTDFATRWNTSVKDLKAAEAGIPYEKLHAQALKILKTRTVAKDDSPVTVDDDKALAEAEACVAFRTTPMEFTTCK